MARFNVKHVVLAGLVAGALATGCQSRRSEVEEPVQQDVGTTQPEGSAIPPDSFEGQGGSGLDADQQTGASGQNTQQNNEVIQQEELQGPAGSGLNTEPGQGGSGAEQDTMKQQELEGQGGSGHEQDTMKQGDMEQGTMHQGEMEGMGGSAAPTDAGSR